MPESDNIRTIHYKLKFSEDHQYDFSIHLDNQTLDIIQTPKKSYPEWTKLKCKKCSNCPLDDQKHEYCPIAVNITDLIDFFSKPIDFDEVELHVETPERTFSKKIDYKTAARSLLGIYMVTSGCPIMDKLRPMAQYHLPLATSLETTYRSISNYLIAQYLLSLQGKTPDWELKNLSAIYESIKTVNMHFRERLQVASNQKHALNALHLLDSSAFYINLSLSGEAFETIESLFYEEHHELKEDDPLHSVQEDAGDSDSTITFQYQFKGEDNTVKEFPVEINRKTLNLINKSKDSFPAWTELTSHKCPNCPLDEAQHKYCPAACGVSETIEFFNETLSIESGSVTVKTAERDYSKESIATTYGISSMMGLIMASSGCPVLGKLKPMVRSHLPFASADETIYRSLGMYLFTQYFQSKSGKKPDWKLENFSKLYEEINIVNKAFSERLKSAKIEDASLNALVHLDCFAQIINITVSDGHIKDLQNLFKAYLEE